MFKRVFCLIILMGAMSSGPLVWAVDPANPASAPANAALPQTNLSHDVGLVSLNFQDADIRNVLKVLAFKSGVNIVAAPDVTGIVNMELKDVSWKKALDVILSTYGYGFIQKDNIITVMTIEKVKKYREDSMSMEAQEPLISKTYPLSFAKAEDTMKIIDKLISKRGFINFDERTNSIIIRDLESNLALISGVIKSIDTVTPQVSIEVKVIETDLTKNENTGVDWVLQANLTGAAEPSTFPFTNKQWYGYGNNSFLTPSTTPTLPAAQSAFLAPPPTLASPSAGLAGYTYGTISASQLSATLNILSSRATTKVLSNPRIVTLDNQKATINVGEEYPEATYSFNSSTGAEQVTGFTTLPIGVNLEVTPHVNNAGLITLEVHPQISGLITTVPQVGGAALPETSNQEAVTNVMVEDGKTLVIGGMITDKTTVNTSKVPVLGDLPFMGSLFRSSQTQRTKTEVLVFLTPHIITAGKNSASFASSQ